MMPSAPSTFSYHSLARCASPALPPAPSAMAGMPRAIGTFASVEALELGVAAQRAVGGDRRLDERVRPRRHAGRPVAQEPDLDAQRRRAGRAAAVLVVRGALERRA